PMSGEIDADVLASKHRCVRSARLGHQWTIGQNVADWPWTPGEVGAGWIACQVSAPFLGDEFAVLVNHHQHWNAAHSKLTRQRLLGVALLVRYSQPRHLRIVLVELALAIVRAVGPATDHS